MMELRGVKPIEFAPEAMRVHRNANDSAVSKVTASFGDLLEDALTTIEQQEKQVETLNKQFLAGQQVDVHNIMIAAERAQLGLQLTVQVRNKVVEAYQEMMRIQL